MKLSRVTAFLLVLLLAIAQFAVGARAQDLSSDKTKTLETAQTGDSPKADIVKNPLRPPDTSSPRATLQSFLQNINRAYAMLMAAHHKNLKTPGLFAPEHTGLVRQYVVLLPLFLWMAFAWAQTIPMHPRLVQGLSSASHTAYTDWIEPFVSREGLPDYFPVSVAAEQSKHSLAVMMLLGGVAWAASIVFLSRRRVSMLLSLLALGAARKMV